MVIIGRRVASIAWLSFWVFTFYCLWFDGSKVEPNDPDVIAWGGWLLAGYGVVFLALLSIACTIGAKIHCLATEGSPGRWHIWSLASFTVFIALAYTFAWAIPADVDLRLPIITGASYNVFMLALCANIIYDAFDLLQDRLRRSSWIAEAMEYECVDRV